MGVCTNQGKERHSPWPSVRAAHGAERQPQAAHPGGDGRHRLGRPDSGDDGVEVELDRPSDELSEPKDTKINVSLARKLPNGRACSGGSVRADQDRRRGQRKNLEGTLGYTWKIGEIFSIGGSAGIGEKLRRERSRRRLPSYVCACTPTSRSASAGRGTWSPTASDAFDPAKTTTTHLSSPPPSVSRSTRTARCSPACSSAGRTAIPTTRAWLRLQAQLLMPASAAQLAMLREGPHQATDNSRGAISSMHSGLSPRKVSGAA